MKRILQRTKVGIVFMLFLLSIILLPTTAQAAPRPADVEKAGDGNVLVGVSGSYERVSKEKILKRINQIRKEACTKGYINPSTGEKLKSSDYVPIKWSANLEWIAQLRAAECTVNEDHTRPNGASCFSVTYQGEQSWAENLAWNYSGLMDGIEQWYGEKEDWVSQNSSAVTGHYTSLINPEYQFIGLGSFVRDSGGWYGISAEFGYNTAGSQAQSKVKGKTVQIIEVIQKNTKMKIKAGSSVKVKENGTLEVVCSVTYPAIMGGENVTEATSLENVTWKSSKPSVLSVNSSGKFAAKKTGKATVSAQIEGGKTIKKTITVKKK